MYRVDITDKVKKIILFGLAGVLTCALIIGYAEFKYWHKSETLQLDDAKVVGTMVSVRVLANGKVKELPFEDGAEVKAGDVIARLEVSITEEEIKQLENTVQLAKNNYATLQEGQWVKVPVQRERVITTPSTSAPSGNLAKLEERANRMAELFEMGAVSAVQRDAARRAYENARSQGYSSAGESRVEYYTEYVDEFRPTPPEVLAGAEQAIKQAELSLNVALQEARETDVIAPVNGTIYYGVEVEQALSAGDSVARIGDSHDLWLEAEVTEEIFDKISLGKLVSFVIDGKEIFGTVTEKIKPDEKKSDESAPVELPDIPTSTNQPAALIGEGQAQPSAGQAQPAEGQTQPAEGQAQPAQGQTQPAQGQAQPAAGQAQSAQGQAQSAQGQPPKLPDGTEDQAKPNDKFIIKISLPAERDFECRPNTETVVKINLRN